MSPLATINYSIDIDWWKNAVEIDSFSSSLLFDSSENGLWNGKFVPPPPRPPFLNENITLDLSSCDLCSWAWKNESKAEFSINNTFGKKYFNKL